MASRRRNRIASSWYCGSIGPTQSSGTTGKNPTFNACHAVGRMPTSVAIPVWMSVRTRLSRSTTSSGVPINASTRNFRIMTSPGWGFNSSIVAQPGVSSTSALSFQLSAGSVRKRLSLSSTLAIAAGVIALSGFPIALAPPRLAVALTALGLFVYGFAAVVWTISSGAYRQATTPSELLGRTGSVMRVAAWGPIPVASLVAGAVASASSTRTAMVVAAIGAVAAGVPVNVWRLRGAPD